MKREREREREGEEGPKREGKVCRPTSNRGDREWDG